MLSRLIQILGYCLGYRCLTCLLYTALVSSLELKLLVLKIPPTATVRPSTKASKQSKIPLMAQLVWLTAVLFCSVYGSEEEKCLGLSDPRNEIWSPDHMVWLSLEAAYGSEVQQSIQERAMMATKMLNYKPLDQCLGSIRIEDSFLSILPILTTEQCRKTTFKYFGKSADLNQFVQRTKAFAQNMQSDFVSYFKYISSIEADRYEDFCHAYQNGFMPCISEGLIPALLQILHQSSNECCQPLFESVPDISSMINDAVHRIGNVACATYDGTQRCGHRFIQSFMSKNWAKTIYDLAFLLETPNNQGCAAFTAQKYTVTTGKYVAQLGTVETSWDSCAVYWDELWTLFASYPIKQPLLQSLFQPRSCVTLLQLEPFVPSGMIDMYRNFMSGRCFHLTNSFSKACRFYKGSVPLQAPSKSNRTTNYSKFLDKTVWKLLVSKIAFTW